ncbi:glycosyltransferase [Thalassotalea nanhaiensis]|uniref:Glycosyltransferase n=1 Tax=Thalassotalea nanhaiensis TaxID=3065648 RepID=A0ABY9TIC0_9GAMM|nr:glycosyltransferase [Colwelliaceae bacterium SQ345]
MTTKVVHLVYSFGCGGLEKVIVNLVNYSNEFDVEHIIISLTDDLSMAEQLQEKCAIYQLEKKQGNDFSSHKKLYQLLKNLKPDVFHTYNFGTIEYQLTAKFLGVGLLIHSDHGRGGDDPDGKNIQHNIFRYFVAKLINRYIVVSLDLYQWIKDVIRVKKKNLFLVFNGVKVKPYTFEPSDSVKSFVTVGRLESVKNQKLLIDSYLKAKTIEPRLKLTKLDIIGDGPLFDEMEGYIKEKNAENSISLKGYQEDVDAFLENSDVFLLSSNYEAMPLTILEAMAKRVPVVCTDVGGISTFITPKEAWFVEPNNVAKLADAIISAFQDKQSRLEKASNAYRLVKESYSIESMVNKYMEIYQVSKFKAL